MAAEPRFVKIQAGGQLTLPVEAQRRLGLAEGDLVAIADTPSGLLVEPRKVAALRALDEIADMLEQEGATLEELIESGREIRGALFKEKYGIDAGDDSTLAPSSTPVSYSRPCFLAVVPPAT